MPDDHISTKIKAMFNQMSDLSDQIFESMCTQSDQIAGKKHNILKQLIEQKCGESYKHIDPKP